jgi:peptide/nickel transport system substrate-binding protein
LPTGPWFEAMRSGNFDVTTEGNCQNVVNPLADVGKYLPNSVSSSNYGQFDDPKEVEMYNRQLRELDKTKQKADLLEFNKYVLDEQVHAIYLLWWQRVVPHRSYVKGWKIGPSHYVNQDLGTIWLDK